MKWLAVMAVMVSVVAALIADIAFADTAIASGTPGVVFLGAGVAVSVSMTRARNIPDRWRRGARVAIAVVVALSLVRWIVYLA